ncbi:MAG TPA: glucan biosynthesis protein [Sphingomonas sp.]
MSLSPSGPSRRDLLALIAALPAARLRAATGKTSGQPYSWETLKARAAAMAHHPYVPPPKPAPGIAAVDYDALNSIHYRGDKTLLTGSKDDGGVRCFPITHFQPTPVGIFVVEDGTARPLHYSPFLFDMPADSPLGKLGPNGGLSGFRVMNKAGESDWLAFAGASYFRSSGALDQYGQSARGLAIDTGGPLPEEFPSFTDFWLGRDAQGALIVDALLQGPRVVGAYHFVNRKTEHGVVQDVEMSLHVRKPIARLGIAPLTSMFWYDQSNRDKGVDWRPEIHDSDGLLMLNGQGERIWRPLNNPPRVMVNSFADTGAKGFGLMQRDRDFDHYQDDGVFYDKRPTAWIEPKGDWGVGAVTLVELPTDSETQDNIVAFWTPAAPVKAGATFDLAYRLRWIAGEPLPEGPARVIDFWRGSAGPPGSAPIPGATKLVIDFLGKALAGLDRSSGVVADIDVTRGKALNRAAYPVVGQPNRWRLTTDIAPDGKEPADIRAILRAKSGEPLTEVCITQLFPA